MAILSASNSEARPSSIHQGPCSVSTPSGLEAEGDKQLIKLVKEKNKGNGVSNKNKKEFT